MLVDEINHYILIKDINKFISNNSHVVKSCRNCLNGFCSLDKYNFHIEYCKNRKPKKLLPSFKKYMQFENLKNCIKRNWIIHSDFECIIDPNTKEHQFISGGYLLECKNEKCSKNIQTFYNLEEYTKSLYNELKYIEDTEENCLQNPIDYSNFDLEKFDNTLKCEYCDCQFNHSYNHGYIILNEIVDKEKLKYKLDNNLDRDSYIHLSFLYLCFMLMIVLFTYFWSSDPLSHPYSQALTLTPYSHVSFSSSYF